MPVYECALMAFVSKAIATIGEARKSEEVRSRHRSWGMGILVFTRNAKWLGITFIFLAKNAHGNDSDLAVSASFRPGGNVSVLSSVQQMRWHVIEAGGVKNQRFWSFSPGIVARYAFHFQFVSKFGGVVGTDVALNHEWAQVGQRSESACSENGFRPGASISLPSLTLGLVQNYREGARIMLLGQYTGTMFPWMKSCTATGKGDQLLSAIPNSFAVLGQWDVFLDSSRAFSLGIGYRNQFVQCVGKTSVCLFGAEKTSALERLNLSSEGLVLQIGMTWQAGAEER